MTDDSRYKLIKNLTVILLINLFSPGIMHALFGVEMAVIPLIFATIFGASVSLVMNVFTYFATFPIAIIYIIEQRRRRKNLNIKK